MCVFYMVDHRAHLGHGLNGDDALDCQVGLIIDSQAIRGRPVTSILSMMCRSGVIYELKAITY